MQTILVVSGNPDKRVLMNRLLSSKKYVVACTDCGQTTARWLKLNKPDVAFCDLPLNDMTSIQLLGRIKGMHPGTMVIFTGVCSVSDTVELVKSGAYDCIAEPILPDRMLGIIREALSEQLQETCAPKLQKSEIKTSVVQESAYNNQYVAGNSSEFAEIAKQVHLVSPTNFSVIIYGPSGSGKEAIAQQIHQKSKRADKPFVAIDCGALSRELSGSELFGHEKGSFTGALNQKIGSLEIANGGTIFLDEIGNLTYEIQVSLLRVVQERKIRRIGGIKDIDIDVRIIVASNVNLLDAARTGKFREDLYHRFNEFTIALPSLSERKQDIMLLAHRFLAYTNAELGKRVVGFTKDVENRLVNYIWHGNIRELKNVIKRATLLTSGDFVEVSSLPAEINNYFKLSVLLVGVKADNSPKIVSALPTYQIHESKADVYLRGIVLSPLHQSGRAVPS